MPLLSIFRLLTTILSWAVLAGAAYLIWRWFQGTVAVDQEGREVLIREPWMLWVGIPLAGWSLLGKSFWNFILAQASDEPVPARDQGVELTGADGATLYVETDGPAKANTIILTHGAGMDSTVWYLAKRHLAQRFRVISWDLPGLGKSAAGKIDLDSYAENLAIVVKSAAVPVVVVGHSMGGMTIQTLAKRRPEMFGSDIAGVVLLNTTYTDPLKTMILSKLAQGLRPVLQVFFYLEIALLPVAWISAWQSYLSGSTHIANRLTFGKGVSRRQLDHVALLGTRNSPASIARGNLAMINWDATGAIANVPGPVLIVAGDGDIVTKPEASAQIAGKAVSPVYHAVERSNHMSFLDHSTTYHQLIEGYAHRVFQGQAADLAQRRRTSLPTGPGTASKNDVADPHPSDGEHYDRIKLPGGGATTPKGEAAGLENAGDDGRPAKRPKNAETE